MKEISIYEDILYKFDDNGFFASELEDHEIVAIIKNTFGAIIQVIENFENTETTIVGNTLLLYLLDYCNFTGAFSKETSLTNPIKDSPMTLQISSTLSTFALKSPETLSSEQAEQSISEFGENLKVLDKFLNDHGYEIDFYDKKVIQFIRDISDLEQSYHTQRVQANWDMFSFLIMIILLRYQSMDLGLIEMEATFTEKNNLDIQKGITTLVLSLVEEIDNEYDLIVRGTDKILQCLNDPTLKFARLTEVVGEESVGYFKKNNLNSVTTHSFNYIK